MRFAILLFDGVDLMDVAGPYEVLLTAARLQVRRGVDPTFEVVTMAPGGNDVTAFGGLVLRPHVAAESAGRVDVLVVPGAVDIDGAGTDQLIEQVGQLAVSAAVTASVCTGAFLLERAGLLDDVDATTHWRTSMRWRALAARPRSEMTCVGSMLATS